MCMYMCKVYNYVYTYIIKRDVGLSTGNCGTAARVRARSISVMLWLFQAVSGTSLPLYHVG